LNINKYAALRRSSVTMIAQLNWEGGGYVVL
jgi:hypothetical protein